MLNKDNYNPKRKNQKNFLKLKRFSAKHDLHKTAFGDEEKNQQNVSPQMMKPEIKGIFVRQHN